MKDITVLGCALLFVFWFLFSLLIASVFQNLWNWLMPSLLDLPVITFWQAYGLTMLLSLVGGFFKGSSKG